MDCSINPHDFLSARDAAALLGVKLATLYAYASRGLVRTLTTPTRKRLYARADLLKLKARHDARAGHGAVAASAMHWGEAVLDTAVSTFDRRGPIYRGHLATDLAARATPFESVAELLWTSELPVTSARWPMDSGALPPWSPNAMSPLRAMLLALPAMTSDHEVSWETPQVLARARALISRLALVPALTVSPVALDRASAEPVVSRRLLHALGSETQTDFQSAVELALVLCADHELNPSTFTARVAASAGADLDACMTAAMATLTGPRHGGVSQRVEAMVREIGSPERVRGAMLAYRARGESVPGFGHPMYPDGDPRARAMLDCARALAPERESVRTVMQMVQTARELGMEPASLDAGLVAVALAVGMAPGGAGAMFAIGRTAGWVAHAMEQHATGVILRPRARYIGP